MRSTPDTPTDGHAGDGLVDERSLVADLFDDHGADDEGENDRTDEDEEAR